MNALDSSHDDTLRARENLLRIHAACLANRHACFPKHAAEIGHADALQVVILGTRGPGFSAHVDQIEAAVALRGGRLVAVVQDAGDGDPGPVLARRRREQPCPVVSIDAFFANAPRFAGCIVIDRTCTWYPGVRYKVRLRQAGLRFLRVEQFLNAPGLEAAGGSWRAHSDVMLARFAEFMAIEKLWKDELSLQTYYYALAAFISMNHEYFVFHCGDYATRYFALDVGLQFDESTVYADCGSHDGQEVLIFAGLTGHRFQAIHAFEPDHHNFIVLSDCIARYMAEQGARPVYGHELGVYDRNAFLATHGVGTDVSIAADAAEAMHGAGIHVCRLDDTIERLSHLRLEVEGAELPALHGARRLIERYRPSMTVSAYHKETDFLDITRFLEDTGHSYRLLLRHQSLEPGVLCIYAV